MNKKVSVVALFAIALNLTLISPVLAIPSPDVVISLFASAAQVLALLTAVVGGMGLANKYHPNSALKTANRAQPKRQWLFYLLLGSLILSLGANLLQYTNHLDRQNTRLQTNLTRSSKESGQSVGDTSLKTLSFSDQINHPNGLTADEFARKLAANKASGQPKLHLIDVREPEEIEMGKIPGAIPKHYPDLLRHPEKTIQNGQETVLLCYSGNRSSELCTKLAELGISCKFVIGGYEKWIAEGRPLTLTQARSSKQLRNLPSYPNQTVLLDTPAVEKLVQQENAIFVDVRYPGDFELGHLPNAINIPLRKLPQEEMRSQLKALPKRPIIAPCYDKRSCFYSQILGLRLHRLGYDFRGRYTVPHEYTASPPQQTQNQPGQTNSDPTLLGWLSTPLTQTLNWVQSQVGHLALAILITVLLLRLFIFPLTFKGEQDQLLLGKLSPQIAQLKQKIGNDQQRFSRALLALYRKHHLTPGLNLLGTAVQILLFLLFFRVVNTAAQNSPETFLWIPQLSAPDPLFLLPLTIGGLTFLHLQHTATRPGHLPFILLRSLGGFLLAGITWPLSAAVQLYLAASLVLMLLQNQLVKQILGSQNRSTKTANPLPPRTIVPLRLAHRVPGTGNKAGHLAQLIAAGLPVPNGFVITNTLLSQNNTQLVISQSDWRQIKTLWKRLNVKKVAVRSSGTHEDGTDRSYAGIFESVLNVEWQDIYPALKQVYDSWQSDRTIAYSDLPSETGGILIQEMVDAEFAGVLFTQHPTQPCSLLIEMVPGIADNLVSGKVTPKTYRFLRVGDRPIGSDLPPINLTPLIEFGKQVENLFGHPQDIEWAYRAGRFLLLQSRNIILPPHPPATALSPAELLERKKCQLLQLAAESKPDDTIFAQNEISELLPCPTPLSLSLMETLWKAGGTIDLACRALGLPYDVTEDGDPLLISVFGNLYINLQEEKRRLSRSPNLFVSFRLIKAVDQLEQQYRQEHLPTFLQQITLWEALDLSQLETDNLFELFEQWSGHFIQDTYFQAQTINIAADFSLKLAERELKQRQISPATYLGHMPETIVHHAMSLLPEIQAGTTPISSFLDVFGHRAPYDFEIAQPRYHEAPELVKQLLENAPPPTDHNTLELPKLPASRLLRLTIERARKFQALKEEAKHHALRELALLRKLLLQLGQRLQIGEKIFYYALEELPLLCQETYRQQSTDRETTYQAEIALARSLQLPARLTLAQLEDLSLEGKVKPKPAAGDGSDRLHGTLVAGNIAVEGQAQVIATREEIENFKEGNILVTRFTHPSWVPMFPTAQGIVTEVGGWLSHAAIVAREYNVTTIVGVQGALDKIDTGDRLKLHLDGMIERL